jgi:hypothetical protein
MRISGITTSCAAGLVLATAAQAEPVGLSFRQMDELTAGNVSATVDVTATVSASPPEGATETAAAAGSVEYVVVVPAATEAGQLVLTTTVSGPATVTMQATCSGMPCM